jgi:hypothetical protein
MQSGSFRQVVTDTHASYNESNKYSTLSGRKKVFATQIDVRSSDVYFLVVGTPPIQE